MKFQKKLEKISKKNNSLVCVGLDSVWEKIPSILKKGKTKTQAIIDFNKKIVDATYDLVCAYKPNIAFYEAQGIEGLKALKKTINYIRKKYPEIPIILDAKRGDIGNTNEAYIKLIFDYLKVDAVTLHSYLGKEALMPFLNLKNKFFFILCRTSNPGAGEFQDLKVRLPGLKGLGFLSDKEKRLTFFLSRNPAPKALNNLPFIPALKRLGFLVRWVKGEQLYKYIAKSVAKKWNFNNNCGLVIGATYPEELAKVRKIAGEMTFLIPGIGKQGGGIEKTIKAGKNSKGLGMVINSSRGIIFASKGRDFAKAARKATEKLRKEINKYR